MCPRGAADAGATARRSRNRTAVAAGSVVAAGALLFAAISAAVTQPAGPTGSASPELPRPTPIAAMVEGLPVFTIPESIDATGVNDASGPLIAFVESVPDGSTIVFRAGGIYRMDRGLVLTGRRDLHFEGNGATLRSRGPSSCTRDCSLFYLHNGNHGITIRSFYLVGNAPSPGVYDPNWEHASGVTVVGGSRIEIANVVITGVGGDGLTLSGGPETGPDGVTFRDSHVKSAGRNGVSVISGRTIAVERVFFDVSGYCTFDIEPNVSSQGAAGVRFVDNVAGTWTNSFLSAEGAAGSAVSDVTVSGNTVTGASLKTLIQLPRRQNIVFTNNVSLVAADGPVLRFAYVDGLTVSGNAQPLRSGTLARIRDSTGVDYSP